MRNIYTRATEVVVYLGEAPYHEFGGGPSRNKHPSALSVFHGDERDKEKIFQFQSHCSPEENRRMSGSKKKLNYAHEVCCLISLLAQSSNLENVPPFDAESRPCLDSFYQRNIFEALRYLMRSSWWDRIWVVQEVVVPKNVILIYDTTTTCWEMFVKAAQTCTKNSSSLAMSSFPREYSDVLSFFSRIVLDIYHLRCRCENAETTTLLSLLRKFSNRKASDDRDKVYALLGLVTETTASKTLIMQPNYSWNTVTVFENTVFGIIQETGSLSILTGDLGRKNRQNLPSWAVDWSAAFDDVNRRRAEDTENYNASAGAIIKIRPYNDESFSEISQYLEALEAAFVKKEKSIPPTVSLPEKYTLLLESEEWKNYVTSGAQQVKVECLKAIEHFLAIHKGVVWIRRFDNILVCPSMYKGEVVVVGKPIFSNDDLEYLVRTWASTISIYHEDKKKHDVYVHDLDEAFSRALCADMAHPDSHIAGAQPRRATCDEIAEIKSWIWELGGSAVQSGIWRVLTHEQATSCTTSRQTNKLSASMLAAIKIATFRRRLFITDTGLIGIGPAGLQKGDKLHILLGGKAPFLLRGSGTREIPLIANEPRLGWKKPPCYELIGDCFVHGLMDGEGMEGWIEAATRSFEHSITYTRMSLERFEERNAIQSQVDKGKKVVQIMKSPEFELWLKKARSEAKIDEASEMNADPTAPGTVALGGWIEHIDNQITAWLEEHGLMDCVRNADLRDSMNMVVDVVERLKGDLKLAKEKLDSSAMSLQQFELGNEDETRVYIV